MKIVNDIIEFDDGDVQQLSPGLQKALAKFVGPKLPPSTALNNAVNTVLKSAKRNATNAVTSDLAKLAEALAVADDAKQAEVKAYIDQAKAAVGVAVSPLAPTPKDEIPAPGLIAKIKNLFQ